MHTSPNCVPRLQESRRESTSGFEFSFTKKAFQKHQELTHSMYPLLNQALRHEEYAQTANKVLLWLLVVGCWSWLWLWLLWLLWQFDVQGASSNDWWCSMAQCSQPDFSTSSSHLAVTFSVTGLSFPSWCNDRGFGPDWRTCRNP